MHMHMHNMYMCMYIKVSLPFRSVPFRFVPFRSVPMAAARVSVGSLPAHDDDVYP